MVVELVCSVNHRGNEMTPEQLTELKGYLVKASQPDHKCWSEEEDWSACDYSGGNFDDAYWGGLKDGEVTIARDLLAKFFGG